MLGYRYNCLISTNAQCSLIGIIEPSAFSSVANQTEEWRQIKFQKGLSKWEIDWRQQCEIQ